MRRTIRFGLWWIVELVFSFFEKFLSFLETFHPHFPISVVEPGLVSLRFLKFYAGGGRHWGTHVGLVAAPLTLEARADGQFHPPSIVLRFILLRECGPNGPGPEPERCSWVGRACSIFLRRPSSFTRCVSCPRYTPLSLLGLRKNLLRNPFPPNCIVPA